MRLPCSGFLELNAEMKCSEVFASFLSSTSEYNDYLKMGRTLQFIADSQDMLLREFSITADVVNIELNIYHSACILTDL
jgi:hypothetical protein